MKRNHEAESLSDYLMSLTTRPIFKVVCDLWANNLLSCMNRFRPNDSHLSLIVFNLVNYNSLKSHCEWPEKKAVGNSFQSIHDKVADCMFQSSKSTHTKKNLFYANSFYVCLAFHISSI